MTQEISSTQQETVASLHALTSLLPSALDKELASVNLTNFEYLLLDALSNATNNRMRLTLLAEQTNATLPRLSRVVSGLERKGFLFKAPCEADGRATNAILTESGKAVLVKANSLYYSAMRRFVLDGLDEDSLKQLNRIASHILSQIDQAAK